jgi:hypothetical protein
MIGSNLYFIGLGILLVVVISLMWWQARKLFPAGGVGATTEKVIAVPYPFARVCKEAVGAVEDCGWKLAESNSYTGHLKGRIGRSINTLYGQSFMIEVKKADEKSSTIKITCSALYQMMDYGRNNEMIYKFRNWLVNRLAVSEEDSKQVTRSL